MSVLSALLSALSGARHDLICVAAVNINKDYLLRLANNDQAVFNQHKVSVAKTLEDAHIAVPDNDRAKLTNLLLKFSLTEGLPENTATFLHDILTDNKLQIIWKLDSDSTRADFESLIAKYNRDRVVRSGEGLSESEAELWNRVKTFHEFEDGWKWVIAVDEHGEPVGFIHSDVTFKTMKHCGNKPSVKEGDVYYGLRDPQGKEHVTVILDADGKIKESKGYNNAPPKNKAKINPYMQWLMMHPMVKGVSYHRGYARHMNYGVSQMVDDPKFIAKVKKEKPELIHSGVDKIILQWKNWIAKGKKTKDELIEAYLGRKKIETMMLEHVIGILGQFPFTEEQTADLIKRGFLSGIEIANAGTQYLTPVVQDALLDKNTPTVRQNAQTLLQVYVDVPRSKIDVFKLLIAYSVSSGAAFIRDNAPQRYLEMATTLVASKDLVPCGENSSGDKFSRDIYHIIAYVAPAVTAYAKRFGNDEAQRLYNSCLDYAGMKPLFGTPTPGNIIPGFKELLKAYENAGVDLAGETEKAMDKFIENNMEKHEVTADDIEFVLNKDLVDKDSKSIKKLIRRAIENADAPLVKELLKSSAVSDESLNNIEGEIKNPIMLAIHQVGQYRNNGQIVKTIELLASSPRIKFDHDLVRKNDRWGVGWLLALPILYKENKLDDTVMDKTRVTKLVMLVLPYIRSYKATTAHFVKAISQLIDQDMIDPTIQNAIKETIAHSVVHSESVEMLKLLTSRLDVDFNKPDRSGVTAKDLVTPHENMNDSIEKEEMLEVIREYEASKN